MKNNRRKVLKEVMHLSIGCIAISLIRPVPVISKAWFEENGDEMERQTILAFAQVIIPGDLEEDLVIKMLKDPFYGFNKYLKMFIRDLNLRSKWQYGTDRFHKLNAQQREEIIENVLEKPSLMAKLYQGAILLTQIAVYASDKRSIPHHLIDFPQEYFPNAYTYENPYEYLTESITATGHPH